MEIKTHTSFLIEKDGVEISLTEEKTIELGNRINYFLYNSLNQNTKDDEKMKLAHSYQSIANQCYENQRKTEEENPTNNNWGCAYKPPCCNPR